MIFFLFELKQLEGEICTPPLIFSRSGKFSHLMSKLVLHKSLKICRASIKRAKKSVINLNASPGFNIRSTAPVKHMIKIRTAVKMSSLGQKPPL